MLTFEDPKGLGIFQPSLVYNTCKENFISFAKALIMCKESKGRKNMKKSTMLPVGLALAALCLTTLMTPAAPSSSLL
jgi:hypothetical protein